MELFYLMIGVLIASLLFANFLSRKYQIIELQRYGLLERPNSKQVEKVITFTQMKNYVKRKKHIPVAWSNIFKQYAQRHRKDE